LGKAFSFFLFSVSASLFLLYFFLFLPFVLIVIGHQMYYFLSGSPNLAKEKYDTPLEFAGLYFQIA